MLGLLALFEPGAAHLTFSFGASLGATMIFISESYMRAHESSVDEMTAKSAGRRDYSLLRPRRISARPAWR